MEFVINISSQCRLSSCCTEELLWISVCCCAGLLIVVYNVQLYISCLAVLYFGISTLMRRICTITIHRFYTPEKHIHVHNKQLYTMANHISLSPSYPDSFSSSIHATSAGMLSGDTVLVLEGLWSSLDILETHSQSLTPIVDALAVPTLPLSWSVALSCDEELSCDDWPDTTSDISSSSEQNQSLFQAS